MHQASQKIAQRPSRATEYNPRIHQPSAHPPAPRPVHSTKRKIPTSAHLPIRCDKPMRGPTSTAFGAAFGAAVLLLERAGLPRGLVVPVDGFLCPPSRRHRPSLAPYQRPVSSLAAEKTVMELRDELRAAGLPVSGRKAVLIERLRTVGAATPTKEGAEEGTAEGADGGEDRSGIAGKGDAGGPSSVLSAIPDLLLEGLGRRLAGGEEGEGPGLALLPVQERAYGPITSGSDAVLFAPTGSGKTLAFVIPILARLMELRAQGLLVRRRGRRREHHSYTRERETESDTDTSSRCCPPVFVLVPSRELARQVGKVFSTHSTRTGRGAVAAVFGGVPIERHASMLRSDPDVVVGTPGRIRELIREGHLGTARVRTVVLDEADVLLDFGDQPEIEQFLGGIEESFQLVLASATVNDRVREVMKEVMDIDEKSEGYVYIEEGGRGPGGSSGSREAPVVRHWHTAARSSARPGLACDLVATLSPRLGIVFVASKAEAGQVAEQMSDRLTDSKVAILHGDMPQSARSRTVASLRREDGAGERRRSRILVATDVASRGLDLPGVDLVVQFGVPRKSGREGSYDRELYTHRAGRAGRVGGGPRAADAILLYDPMQGEARVLPDLQDELRDVGVSLEPRPLPTPNDVLCASYERAKGLCDDVTTGNEGSSGTKVTGFFRDRIVAEMGQLSPEEREVQLLDRLAAAMAALTGGAAPGRSFLTADPADRTVRVWSDDCDAGGGPLTPPEVTHFAKALGSGKLGRVTICGDGSALFDLKQDRAERLVRAAAAAAKEGELAAGGRAGGSSGPNGTRVLNVELPSALPEGFSLR